MKKIILFSTLVLALNSCSIYKSYERSEDAKIEAGLKEELTDLQHKLAAAKADKGLDSAEATKLRNEIYGLKSKLELAREEKTAQSQYINKLRLLYNQYVSEIEKDELAIEGYVALSKFEFQFCPNCLKPIKKVEDPERCCLCGNEIDTFTPISRIN